jgi:ADP-L-glycero-D-manno-heptose 6-epimerase
MASVVYHAYNQIKETRRLKLFKSHNPNYKDGGQLRDFIYVDDVVDVCIFMATQKPLNGFYNVGTGKARTFDDLGRAVFKSLDIPLLIDYIDTPILIRDKYQYFTEAKTNKLRVAGYNKPFHELEEGVSKYINKLKNETC